MTMKVLWIAFINSIKRHMRNVTPFIMQVISTLIIIIILGTSLRGNFKSTSFLDPIKVAIVNEDKGEGAKELINFLKSRNITKLMKITISNDIESTKRDLKENKYAGVIEIKSNYTEEYNHGSFKGIETYMINNNKTSFQILSSILNGWENNTSAIQTAIISGKSMDEITSELQNNNKVIKEMPLSEGGKLPKSMDYFTITMVVMTLIFSGMNTLGRLQEDFLSDMKNRLQCSPASISYILIGELLGIVLMSFLQMVFVVYFAHFIYGADLGSNYGIFFGTLFLMAVFGQMLAAAVTLGLKNANAPQGIIGSLAMGFAFLAGGFYTSPIKGSTGKFLATYGTPNSLAQTAMFGSIYGGDKTVILTCIVILTILDIILMMVTIGFAKRRIL